MERYLKIKIEKDAPPLTVENVLRKQLKLTRHQISQAKFRPDGITKNGIRCRVTQTAYPGDLICICLEEADTASSQMETFSSQQSSSFGCSPNSLLSSAAIPMPDILYEDEDILAVSKPAGMVTHPTGHHYRDSLANLTASYFREKQESVRIRPVGRLDRDTSGIVIFAKNQPAASRLQSPASSCKIQKQYLAVVSGDLPVDFCLSTSRKQLPSSLHRLSSGNLRYPEYWHTIDTPLMEDPSDHLKMKVCTDPELFSQSRYAITHYCTLFSCPGWSLVTLKLETGRTHQIRIHMASIGHPLLGDSLYHPSLRDPLPAAKTQIVHRNISDGKSSVMHRPSSDFMPFSRAALHAWRISFQHPFRQETVSLEAPLPRDFSEIMQEVL